MFEHKERYQDWSNKEKDIPIFSQPWWMDIVCGPNNWDVYLVGNGNDIKASIVYYLKESGESKEIARAVLTQNNGIHIHYPENQGIIAKQHYEEKIVDEILDHIESLGIKRYDQQFNYKFTYWLPFFWRRYQESLKYTYVIEKPQKIEFVRTQYSSKIRNEFLKASKKLVVEELEDLDVFYSVNRMTFDRQGISIPYTRQMLEKLYNECTLRDSCKILMVKDSEQRIHSVALYVWDREAVYFLLNGSNPELRGSQSNLLLIDEGIKIAIEKGLNFDFEGSVIRGVNHVFREFGGTPMPYFRIYKEY